MKTKSKKFAFTEKFKIGQVVGYHLVGPDTNPLFNGVVIGYDHNPKNKPYIIHSFDGQIKYAHECFLVAFGDGPNHPPANMTNTNPCSGVV
jgi:hypothetical protein